MNGETRTADFWSGAAPVKGYTGTCWLVEDDGSVVLAGYKHRDISIPKELHEILHKRTGEKIVFNGSDVHLEED